MKLAGIQLDWKLVVALVGGGIVATEYLKGQATQAAEAAWGAVNPTSPDNVFNQAVEKTGQAVTGEEGWSLGGQVYDWFHADPKKCFKKVKQPGGGYKAVWYRCDEGG